MRAIQYGKDSRIRDTVIDGRARFPGGENVARAQDRQLLRNRRRFNPQGGLEVGDGAFPAAQEFQNADARRMGQGLEQVGLEVGQGRAHAPSFFNI